MKSPVFRIFMDSVTGHSNDYPEEVNRPSALLTPITVEEARKVHNQLMAYIFSTKYVKLCILLHSS